MKAENSTTLFAVDQTPEPIRLANLEALVCDLLQTNQRLREELILLRSNATANETAVWSEIANPDLVGIGAN